jgi:hypothetical protein
LGALRRSGTALPLWTQLVSNLLSSNLLYQTCCIQCVFVKTHSLGLKTSLRSGRAFALTTSPSRTVSSGLYLWSSRGRSDAPGVRLLRPNRGLVSREAGFSFGPNRTDAALRACVYSDRNVASCRIKRAFPSVKSGPTQRSGREFTSAESWPRAASSGLFLRSNQDRRSASGVRLLWPNRGPVPHQAGFSFEHDDK